MASTCKPVNALTKKKRQHNKTASRWKRLVLRRQARRLDRQRDLDVLQLIIDQNQRVEQNTDRMTDTSDPDGISVTSEDDSLFDPPDTTNVYDSDSESTVSTHSDDSLEICSSTSSTWFDNMSPPPPGSLLDLWDKPFSVKTFHDFPTLFSDGLVTIDTTPTEDTTDDDSSVSSVPTFEFTPHQAPFLKPITATTRVVDISTMGKLVDTGGNFNMCNNLDMLVNVQPITLLELCPMVTLGHPLCHGSLVTRAESHKADSFRDCITAIHLLLHPSVLEQHLWPLRS
jgi:hypothetical protein